MLKPACLLSLLAAASARCPFPDPPTAVLLPHESDCTKFYMCSNGQEYLMSCAPGTHFNKAISVCDWPKNAACQGNSSQDNQKPTTAQSDQDQQTSQNNSTAQPVISTNLTESSNSTQPITEALNLSNATTASTTGIDSSTTGPENITQTEQPVNFTNTTESSNSTQPITEAPNSSNATTASTTGIDSSTTEAENTTETSPGIAGCPPENPEEYLLSDPRNCSKFYSCSNGAPVSMQCPKGLHFNQQLMVCDWPEDAGCKASDNQQSTTESVDSTNQTTESYNSTDTTTESVNSIIPITGSDNSTNPTTEPNSTDQTESDNPTTNLTTDLTSSTIAAEDTTQTVPAIAGCPPENPEEYLLPDPSNCSKFYSCSNGVPVSTECPESLYFNPESMVCDWPINVICASETTTEVTTTVANDFTTDHVSTPTQNDASGTTEYLQIDETYPVYT